MGSEMCIRDSSIAFRITRLYFRNNGQFNRRGDTRTYCFCIYFFNKIWIDSFREAVRLTTEGSNEEAREAVAKHPELNELILIQNALRNGLGDLKTILDIKEKYGLDIVRDLNMLNQVIHDLQELDSRGGTRVG